MESPIVRIVIIAAAVAGAAAVVAIMWTVINSNAEQLDDQSAAIPYESIESQTLCESVEDGAWIQQLEAGATVNTKSYDDEDVWKDGTAECVDSDTLDSSRDGSSKLKARNKKTSGTYATADGGKWELFNPDVLN